MARIHILSARGLNSKPDGLHKDGGNLFLRVRGDCRSWVFRYKKADRQVWLALGVLHARSLAQAREIAARMRTAVADGKDPAAELAGRADPAAKTFKDYAHDLIENNKAVWKNKKHHQQWLNTLSQYAYPTIGDKFPADVTLSDIKDVLTPIWMTKTETASRLRMRIEAVLDYASVLEGIDARNPARWKGNLDKIFPVPHKVSKRKHFASAPYTDVPRIMAELRNKSSLSAYCLRFTILTAARSGEARGCRWAEIDMVNKVWRILGDRMKAGRDHSVPLNDEAMEILVHMQTLRQGELVFQGESGGVLSDVSINKTLHAIASDCTVHGFRSSFSVWCSETTSTPSAVRELALAHVNKNKTEAAYQRSDLFVLRKKLMATWGAHCASNSNVILICQQGKIA
jgi:integrase